MSVAEALRRVGRRAPVPRSSMAVPAEDAAPLLLGTLLVRREHDGGETIVRIVETEAYRESDPASHSYRGRTNRTRVMFGPPGFAYVYFTYGMHFCVNVSCEPDGTGAAVLLRAAIPLTGIERIRERRGPRARQSELLSGPARLTQGLAVDRGLDGADLCDPASPLRLQTDGIDVTGHIVSGPRVGIRHAADRPWRFWLRDVPEVSRYTRHPKAPSAGRR